MSRQDSDRALGGFARSGAQPASHVALAAADVPFVGAALTAFVGRVLGSPLEGAGAPGYADLDAAEDALAILSVLTMDRVAPLDAPTSLPRALADRLAGLLLTLASADRLHRGRLVDIALALDPPAADDAGAADGEDAA